MLVGNHFITWWGLIGIVPILSAIVGFCPLYAMFGINTTACDQHEHQMKQRVDQSEPPRVWVRGNTSRSRAA